MRMSFPSGREHRFHFSACGGVGVILKPFWGDFGGHLETVVINSFFLQGLINRSHFEASFQGGQTGALGGRGHTV